MANLNRHHNPITAILLGMASGSYEAKLNGVKGSIGLGWTADGKRMFFTDSPRKVIWCFDFDADTCQVSSQKVFAMIEGDGVAPDGLCVDTDGCVWSAMSGGGAVVRYDPDGKVIERVQVPVPHPTSCAFGGRDMKTLYVTSESYQLPASVLSTAPQAGGLFAVATQSVGVSVGRFRQL